MTTEPETGESESPSPQTVRFFHGTDAISAQAILQNGLDASLAARYNGSGEFWATTDLTTADWFARTNPANGVPVLFEFTLSEQVFQHLVQQRPRVVIVHSSQDCEFLPPSFDLLNRHMTGQRVVPLP
jgi:hypothetical protein